MYLGMKISELRHRDMINLTVKHKVAKTWGRVAEIKEVINNAKMRRMGWGEVGDHANQGSDNTGLNPTWLMSGSGSTR